MAGLKSMRRTQSAAERSLYDQTNILPRGQLIVVFAMLALTLLITVIDQNGISVTLPTIARDLGAENTISWAGTSSLIANTTFQMLYGRLSDIFGRKGVFLAAVACLALADLLCGLARSGPMFYAFRGVAGVGGGGITNLSMIIISDVVTLQQRGFYQGIIGACIGIGNVIGPFLAAGLIARATWRAYFYTLAPLGALVAVVCFFLMPSKPPTAGFRESARKIDYWGVLTASAAVILVLIPVSGGGAYFPWDSPMVISMLVVGSCLFLVFLVVEFKVAKLPMMPLQIFRNHVVCVIMAQSFLLGAVYQAYLYYLPLFLQNARQFSVIESAGYMMTMVLTQAVFSVMSGQYISRRGRYQELIVMGFGSWTLGAGLMLLNNRHSHPAVIIVPLILIGVGVGTTFQPTLVAVQAYSPKARRAVIISNRNFFRATGGAFGLAVSAAVLQATLRANLPPAYAYVADNAYSAPSLTGPGAGAVFDAYMDASHAVFILQVPLIGVCFLGAFLVRNRGLEPLEDKKDVVAESGSGSGDVEELAGQDLRQPVDVEAEAESEVEAGDGEERGVREEKKPEAVDSSREPPEQESPTTEKGP